MKSFRQARERCELTQTEAAKALGVHQQTLSMYERGRHVPSATLLGKMADLYEVSIDLLIGRIPQSNLWLARERAGKTLGEAVAHLQTLPPPHPNRSSLLAWENMGWPDGGPISRQARALAELYGCAPEDLLGRPARQADALLSNTAALPEPPADTSGAGAA